MPDNSYIYKGDCSKDLTIQCSVIGSSPAAGSQSTCTLASANPGGSPNQKQSDANGVVTYVVPAAQLQAAPMGIPSFSLDVSPASQGTDTATIFLALLQNGTPIGGKFRPPGGNLQDIVLDGNGTTTAATGVKNGETPSFAIGLDCS